MSELGRGERERPLSKRASKTYTLIVQSKRMGRQKAHVTLSRYEDGRLCEVFVTVARTGSDMRTAYEAWAMTSSKALQAGQSSKSLASAIRHIRDDYAGEITSPLCLEGKVVGSLWDALGLLIETAG